MNTNFILNSGRAIPALGLGTWKSAPGEVGAAVHTALETGYRHIDCAAIYGNESEIGEALQRAMADGVARRDDLWVTSKLWNSSHLRADVLPALKKSLADLRLDYLDLYLIHWPAAYKPGVSLARKPEEFLSPEEAPLGETWAAMEEAVDAGLCRHIGVSNFSIRNCERILERARITPAVNQVELHPILAQPELLKWSIDKGIHLTAYSPLGSGDRPAVMKRPDEPQPLESPKIREIAERHGATPAQVLLAWAIERGTSVIPKSVNPGRIRQNFAARSLDMGPADLQAIAALDRNDRIVMADFLCPPGSPYTREWLWG